MLSVASGVSVGTVETIVTSGRGLNPEELTRMVLPKIIFVSPELPPQQRMDAELQRDRLEALLLHYFKQAQTSERTTVYNQLRNAGYETAAELVRSL